MFPGKYHQNGACFMAMLVYRRVGDYRLYYPVMYGDVIIS